MRDYWIYVPTLYDKDKPACVMVVQDGLNRANGLMFGKELNMLYVTCGDSVYKRRINAKGFPVGTSLKPPKPHL